MLMTKVLLLLCAVLAISGQVSHLKARIDLTRFLNKLITDFNSKSISINDVAIIKLGLHSKRLVDDIYEDVVSLAFETNSVILPDRHQFFISKGIRKASFVVIVTDVSDHVSFSIEMPRNFQFYCCCF